MNPVGFSAVQIAPGVVRLSWQEVIAATYYVLFGPGLPEGGVKVFGVNGVGGNTPEIMIAAYTATGVPSGLQEWKVASYYEPGPVSTPASEFTRTLLNVIPPAAVNPTGFTAVQISSARVKLSWQPVAGAAYYVVRGPGLPDSSATVQANLAAGVSSAGTATSSGTVELTANGVASGLRRWTLASYFDPGAVSTPETEFPRVWLNVKPPINPSGFIARQIGPGKVQFIWEAVSGASYYVLTGTGIPPGGARVSGGSAGASGSSVSNSAPLSEDSNAFNTSAPPVSTAASVAMVDFTATGIRAGRGDWFVGSYFDPGGISSEASQFTKVALDVIGPPNPTDLTAVQVAPGQVTIRWKLVSGAAYYWLVGTGLPAGGTKVLLDGLGFATSATAPDAFMTYTVTAVRSGLSAWRVGSYFEPGALSTPVTEYTAVTLNVLPPPNPSGFAAVQTGSGQVRLSFAPVSGAAYYVISGSGLPADGVRIDQVAGASNSTGSVNTIGFTVNGLPPSLASWQVGSYFEPGPVASNAAAFSKVSLTIVSPFQ
ncbi:MAG: hypothetical protein ABI556_14735 [Gemmatimonadales bacterium]